MAVASQVIRDSTGRPAELSRAVDIFTRALSIRPQDVKATSQRGSAKQYMSAYDNVTASKWEDAIAQLEPVYQKDPGYLNGQAAQLLYKAYMASGDALIKDGQPPAVAWQRYQMASELKGVDTSTARAIAANLALNMTPTPTPTATPTATPIPSQTPLPATVAPTPTPAYVPLARLKGKVIFTSDRSGYDQLTVMDADGTNAFSIWQQDKARDEYEKLLSIDQHSPDGRGLLFVQKERYANWPQIFIQNPESKPFRLTDWAGLQYDPAWSPKGHWIAFVSNVPGNDEIYIIGDDAQWPKRLTFGDWEWDKHPSWSPDASQIVWWSNRETGHAQIWVMSADGSNQHNISNNKYNEKDPLWIK
jgi:hypothetical protein